MLSMNASNSFSALCKQCFHDGGMTLGERIRLVRNLKEGRSAKAFGELLGVTSQAVSHWENNHNKPASTHLLNISEICGVSYEWLAKGRGDMYHLAIGNAEHSLDDETQTQDVHWFVQFIEGRSAGEIERIKKTMEMAFPKDDASKKRDGPHAA